MILSDGMASAVATQAGGSDTRGMGTRAAGPCRDQGRGEVRRSELEPDYLAVTPTLFSALPRA